MRPRPDSSARSGCSSVTTPHALPVRSESGSSPLGIFVVSLADWVPDDCGATIQFLYANFGLEAVTQLFGPEPEPEILRIGYEPPSLN